MNVNNGISLDVLKCVFFSRKRSSISESILEYANNVLLWRGNECMGEV